MMMMMISKLPLIDYNDNRTGLQIYNKNKQ